MIEILVEGIPDAYQQPIVDLRPILDDLALSHVEFTGLSTHFLGEELKELREDFGDGDLPALRSEDFTALLL